MVDMYALIQGLTAVAFIGGSSALASQEMQNRA